MGCGAGNQKVQAEDFTLTKVPRAGEHGKKCILCGGASSLSQMLDCCCWVCRPCVLKELENMLTTNKARPLRFACEHCKRKQTRISNSRAVNRSA